jgi:hypothetical protein
LQQILFTTHRALPKPRNLPSTGRPQGLQLAEQILLKANSHYLPVQRYKYWYSVQQPDLTGNMVFRIFIVQWIVLFVITIVAICFLENHNALNGK